MFAIVIHGELMYVVECMKCDDMAAPCSNVLHEYLV